MIRCHKALAEFDQVGIANFTSALNGKRFKYSSHFFERLGERFSLPEQAKIGLLLCDFVLDENTCFEYYQDGDNILKAGYRIPFNADNDLILFLTDRKEVLTVYINAVWDNHKTLRINQYVTR